MCVCPRSPSLIQFFSKMRKWADMSNLSQDFRLRMERLERNFEVSTVIFRKFEPIFMGMFQNPQGGEPPRQPRSRKHRHGARAHTHMRTRRFSIKKKNKKQAAVYTVPLKNAKIRNNHLFSFLVIPASEKTMEVAACQFNRRLCGALSNRVRPLCLSLQATALSHQRCVQVLLDSVCLHQRYNLPNCCSHRSRCSVSAVTISDQ